MKFGNFLNLIIVVNLSVLLWKGNCKVSPVEKKTAKRNANPDYGFSDDMEDGLDVENTEDPKREYSPFISGKSLENYQTQELSSLRDEDEDSLEDGRKVIEMEQELSGGLEVPHNENVMSNYQYASPYLYESPELTHSSLKASSYRELPPLKKDNICSYDSNTPECACSMNCRPNMVYTYTPCQCVAIGEDEARNRDKTLETPSYSGISIKTPSFQFSRGLDQPPVLSDQLSAVPNKYIFQGGSYKNQMVSQEPKMLVQISSCAKPENYLRNECSCYRSCIQRIPSASIPCDCSQFSDAKFYANSFPEPSTQLTPSYFLNMVESYHDNQGIRNENQDHYSDDMMSCERSCIPYTVVNTNPCTCSQGTATSSYVPDNQVYEASRSLYVPFLQSASNYISANTQNYPSSFSNYGYGYYNRPNNAFKQNNYADEAASRSDFHANQPVHQNGVKLGYLGCFKDKKKPGRDLKLSTAISKLTPESCVKKCSSLHKRFAAVQYGYLCYCGSRFGRFGRLNESECNTPCVGDHTKKCGGKWANSVYSTDGQMYHENQFTFTSPDPTDEMKAAKEEISRSKPRKVTKAPEVKKGVPKAKQSKPEAKVAIKKPVANKGTTIPTKLFKPPTSESESSENDNENESDDEMDNDNESEVENTELKKPAPTKKKVDERKQRKTRADVAKFISHRAFEKNKFNGANSKSALKKKQQTASSGKRKTVKTRNHELPKRQSLTATKRIIIHQASANDDETNDFEWNKRTKIPRDESSEESLFPETPSKITNDSALLDDDWNGKYTFPPTSPASLAQMLAINNSTNLQKYPLKRISQYLRNHYNRTQRIATQKPRLNADFTDKTKTTEGTIISHPKITDITPITYQNNVTYIDDDLGFKRQKSKQLNNKKSSQAKKQTSPQVKVQKTVPKVVAA